jgi:hypothetical protein
MSTRIDYISMYSDGSKIQYVKTKPRMGNVMYDGQKQ